MENTHKFNYFSTNSEILPNRLIFGKPPERPGRSEKVTKRPKTSVQERKELMDETAGRLVSQSLFDVNNMGYDVISKIFDTQPENQKPQLTIDDLLGAETAEKLDTVTRNKLDRLGLKLRDFVKQMPGRGKITIGKVEISIESNRQIVVTIRVKGGVDFYVFDMTTGKFKKTYGFGKPFTFPSSVDLTSYLRSKLAHGTRIGVAKPPNTLLKMFDSGFIAKIKEFIRKAKTKARPKPKPSR